MYFTLLLEFWALSSHKNSNTHKIILLVLNLHTWHRSLVVIHLLAGNNTLYALIVLIFNEVSLNLYYNVRYYF